MWLAKNQLSIFQELAELGLRPSFEVGSRVGRGFADLGFEEYCILPGNRLQSLLTGTITQLVDQDKGKLFGIFSPDELIEKIVMSGFDVSAIKSPDQRGWNLEMNKSSSDVTLVKGKSLLMVCCEALKVALKEDK